LPFCQGGSDEDESPGCCVAYDLLGVEGMIQKLFREILTKLRKGTVDVPGGDLFASDFKHEL
jgi:hypothetical protein